MTIELTLLNSLLALTVLTAVLGLLGWGIVTSINQPETTP
jgi:hypothetical protein